MASALFEKRSPMPAPADEVFAWHARPGTFERLQPPWEDVRVESRSGPFAEGQRVTLRIAGAGPFGSTWVAEHYGFEPGRRFRDRQVSGPFAAWDHTHSMIPDGQDRSLLEDRIEYQLPLGGLGSLFGGGLVRGKLDRMFTYRHTVTASDLRRHGRFRDRPRLTVAVTGSTGLVGADLVPFLTTGGHTVVRLVRKPRPPGPDDGTTARVWDPETADPTVLAGVDAVVHLAGENIADGRWDAAKKARIRDSRVGPTRNLAEAAAKAGVKTFVSASAIGFYGDRGDEELLESSPRGDGFFPDVCEEWETATRPATDAGVRVVLVRTGVALSPKAGALAKQLPAFRAGGGAVLGDGRQWVPWITVNDLVGVYHHALMTDDLSGPLNATAPHPVTNRAFGRSLASVLGRPFVLTVPGPALRVLFGEMADAALLASTRVLPGRLTAMGFDFDHPELEPALRFVLGK